MDFMPLLAAMLVAIPLGLVGAVILRVYDNIMDKRADARRAKMRALRDEAADLAKSRDGTDT